jgi:phage terminase small subunit
MALNRKQELFCKEYLVDLNASGAALRAGYSKKTYGSMGFENLQKPEIVSRIQELMDARSKRVERTADDVLIDLQLVKADAMKQIADRDGNLLMANHAGALKALELEGKHLKMFTDKTELTGANGGPLNHSITVSFVDP